MKKGPDWRTRAACLGLDPEIFFPISSTGPVAYAELQHARQICSTCPVRQACLNWAITIGADYGVWGGHSEDERRRLRRARSRTPSKATQ